MLNFTCQSYECTLLRRCSKAYYIKIKIKHHILGLSASELCILWMLQRYQRHLFLLFSNTQDQGVTEKAYCWLFTLSFKSLFRRIQSWSSSCLIEFLLLELHMMVVVHGNTAATQSIRLYANCGRVINSGQAQVFGGRSTSDMVSRRVRLVDSTVGYINT